MLRLYPNLNGLARYQFIVEYLGGGYRGVQFQPGLPTVEGAIRKALKRVGCGSDNLILAARTDSGVHSVGQVATVDVESPISVDGLLKGMNCCLPSDIRVKAVSCVPGTFHPRGAARYREYRYWVTNEAIPLPLGYSISTINSRLDIKRLNFFAEKILGTHDFSGFQKVGSTPKSTEKCIIRSEFIEVKEESKRFLSSLNLVCYVIVADSFLYRMVRNLVGAMLNAADGRLTESQFSFMLDEGIRRWPYVAAPPEGLELFKIYY